MLGGRGLLRDLRVLKGEETTQKQDIRERETHAAPPSFLRHWMNHKKEIVRD